MENINWEEKTDIELGCVNHYDYTPAEAQRLLAERQKRIDERDKRLREAPIEYAKQQEEAKKEYAKRSHQHIKDSYNILKPFLKSKTDYEKWIEDMKKYNSLAHIIYDIQRESITFEPVESPGDDKTVGWLIKRLMAGLRIDHKMVYHILTPDGWHTMKQAEFKSTYGTETFDKDDGTVFQLNDLFFFTPSKQEPEPIFGSFEKFRKFKRNFIIKGITKSYSDLPANQINTFQGFPWKEVEGAKKLFEEARAKYINTRTDIDDINDIVNDYMFRQCKNENKMNFYENEEFYEKDNYKDMMENIEIIKEHFTSLAKGNIPGGRYLLNILAMRVQQPHRKTEVMVILQGPQGAGKSTPLETIVTAIFGEKEVTSTNNCNNLSREFNSQFAGKLFLLLEETNNTKKVANILKDLTTRPKCFLRPLYQEGYEVENLVMPFIMTNNASGVKVEQGDRRTVAFECLLKSRKYYNRLAKVLGIWNRWKPEKIKKRTQMMGAVFAHYLKSIDLSNFDPRDIPMTELKQDLINITKGTVQLYVDQKLYKHVDEKQNSERSVKAVELFKSYKKFCDNYPDYKRRVKETFCKEIKQCKLPDKLFITSNSHGVRIHLRED